VEFFQVYGTYISCTLYNIYIYTYTYIMYTPARARRFVYVYRAFMYHKSKSDI